ncbi:TraM recognition domain-containing protein [Crossiella sp. SN42]|uniref:type IV secretory system conjugative DNA transfer family protein n=1 Tax=Crossiella sp. SN42 TaxID=2944808 RepID=UPI00207D5CA5|nr:TraM recognition domain-containing protein [Crossiella sp. SN42]MCO1575585.1 TraM recognition domain-containing protein [Crossiella sp. SN42]
MRIIARSGWGKTEAVLVPTIRSLPGPAIVGSIEPAIFTRTVIARRFRRRELRWRWLSLVLRLWCRPREFPVAVLDCTDPEARQGAGWPQVTWNVLVGCESLDVATRYATALVHGIEAGPGEERGVGNDGFFRQSALEVLAAWFHAARLGGLEIEHVLKWVGRIDHPQPRTVLERHPDADPAALQALRTHLDSMAAAGTTSGVRRYVSLAVRSLGTEDAARISGSQHDRHFDIEDFIRRGGTLYILASPERLQRVGPLVGLFVAEVFIGAQRVALAQPEPHRLPETMIGVFDELYEGVPVPNLPYIVTTLRKYNISTIHAVQSQVHEDSLYGRAAQALRGSVRCTVVGGLDMAVAQELTQRAGPSTVVTPTRSHHITGHSSETVTREETLPISDQQALGDGEAIVAVAGLPLLLARLRSTHQRFWLSRKLRKESAAVSRAVRQARGLTTTDRAGHSEAAKRAGFDRRDVS